MPAAAPAAAARCSVPSGMCPRRVESTRRTSGQRPRQPPPAPSGVAQPQALERAAAGRPGDRDRAVEGGRVLHVERELEVGAHRRVELLQRGDVGGQVGPVRRRRSARRAGPADDAVVVEHRLAVPVSHTSLSRPVAPSRTASAKASSVFSGAWARAPRWANPIGGRRSDGSRVGTTAHCGRASQAAWCSSRHLSGNERPMGRAGRAGRHGNGDQGELPRLRRRRAGAHDLEVRVAPRTSRAPTCSAARAARCRREAGRAPDRRHAGRLRRASSSSGACRPSSSSAAAGDPITHDDLIDFHRLLQDDGLVRRPR